MKIKGNAVVLLTVAAILLLSASTVAAQNRKPRTAATDRVVLREVGRRLISSRHPIAAPMAAANR